MKLNRNTLCAALLVAALGGAQAQEAVRPEVGKPLKAAQEHLKAQRFKEAMARVREADAVGGKTANEQTLIERMRLSAALGAGDNAAAEKAFEALEGSKKLSQADQLKIMESLAGGYYRSKDFAKAMQWAQRYLKEGGGNQSMRQLVLQVQYESGDFASVAKTLQAEVAADEKAGRTPGEDRLQLLAYSQQKLNDNAGYVATLEKLVTHHPKKNYWADLISRVPRKPGFSDRYTLDVYRLRLATDTMSGANDYMEMAQLAVQAGYPAEAKKIVQQGYASGALGKGPEAERHKRLSDLVDRHVAEEPAKVESALAEANAARNGDALVAIGFGDVVGGKPDKGLKLIEQGIAKGQLKRPDEAQLRLGIAQLRAGQKAKAQKTLRAVKGNDGSADLARLWALQPGAA